MRFLLLTMLLAACAPADHDITPEAGPQAGAVALKTEALAAQPCYTAQINAIKARMQDALYYCKSPYWTFDSWNLHNSECSSTNSYGVWIQAGRGNGVSTCSFTVNRIDDDGDPQGYCRWKAGTVNSSNVVTIGAAPNSCW